jgi:hypothetical protein
MAYGIVLFIGRQAGAAGGLRPDVNFIQRLRFADLIESGVGVEHRTGIRVA